MYYKKLRQGQEIEFRLSDRTKIFKGIILTTGRKLLWIKPDRFSTKKVCIHRRHVNKVSL